MLVLNPDVHALGQNLKSRYKSAAVLNAFREVPVGVGMRCFCRQ